VKKDENRFTIRFNTVDPRQKLTRDVLAAVGRRKASFLTDVVCDYLARYGGGSTADNSSLAAVLPSFPIPSHIQAPNNNTTELRIPKNEHPDYDPKLTADVEVVTGTLANDLIAESLFDDDTREAVLDALSMFKM